METIIEIKQMGGHIKNEKEKILNILNELRRLHTIMKPNNSLGTPLIVSEINAIYRNLFSSLEVNGVIKKINNSRKYLWVLEDIVFNKWENLNILVKNIVITAHDMKFVKNVEYKSNAKKTNNATTIPTVSKPENMLKIEKIAFKSGKDKTREKYLMFIELIRTYLLDTNELGKYLNLDEFLDERKIRIDKNVFHCLINEGVVERISNNYYVSHQTQPFTQDFADKIYEILTDKKNSSSEKKKSKEQQVQNMNNQVPDDNIKSKYIENGLTSGLFSGIDEIISLCYLLKRKMESISLDIEREERINQINKEYEEKKLKLQ